MKAVILSSLFLLGLFLVSHYLFEPMYLYHELIWLDIPMHILGGLGVGTLVISLLKLAGIQVSLAQVILLYLVVAFSWELYEYARGAMVYDALYKYLDSVKDIVMGGVGVYVGYKLISTN